MSWNAFRFTGFRPGQNQHHLTPQVHYRRAHEKVDNSDSNKLWMKVEKHSSLHHIFGTAIWEDIPRVMEILQDIYGDKTFSQVIAVHQRISRMKHRGQKPLPII